MGDARYDVIKGYDGVGAVVVTCTVGSENSSEKAEDRNEVKGCFLESALAEGRQRNRYELDAAEKQGQVVYEVEGVALSEGDDDYFEYFKEVDEDSRKNEDFVFVLFGFAFGFSAEKDGTYRHYRHKCTYKDQMLP